MSEYSHNLFFHANVCHVCKAFGKELPLKRCGSCRMISYCGKEHQKQHWTQHRDLCRVLSEMLQKTSSTCLFEITEDSCADSWTRTKTNLMLLVQIKLDRRLEVYEEEMFKFPRVCAVCHEGKSVALEDCQECPSASFCPAHKLKDSSHVKQCAALRLCFDLDVAATLFERQTPRHVVPFHTDTAYLPSTMNGFIELYVNENKSLPMSSECQLAYNSEYLTRPLTLLYTMEWLEYTPESEMTVHVIGANMMEVDGLEVWEILLHWLPSLMELTIILIGPELTWGSIAPNICDCCAAEQMKLHVEIRNMLYQDYVTSQWFEKPDFLICYNTGIHECEELGSVKDTWAPSLRTMAEQNCPLVLTSYTLQEARKEHERVCRILGETKAHVCCARNPFSSLRPHRDFETEGVFYQNQFLTIYQELNPIGMFENLRLT